MAGNIPRYLWYAVFSGFMPWLPIFFLYFSQLASLDEIIRLGAIYYVAVVLLEVPSGYLSDRAGRRITLAIAALALCLAYVAYLLAADITGLLIGQFLLATGIAFQSGSDSALLYDTLKALGREAEYTALESRSRTLHLAGFAAACLVGGVLGSIELQWVYIAALLAGGVTLWLALSFVEPPPAPDAEPVLSAIEQFRRTFAYLRDDALLRWITLSHVTAFALLHIIYELNQPWVQLLQTSASALPTVLHSLAPGDSTPLITGVVAGVSMLGGSLGAASSLYLLARLGLARLLLASVLLPLITVALMGLMLHPLLLIPIAMRGFAMAMAHGPMMGAIAPRIQSSRRATFLSLQSLLARLTFSASMFLLSWQSRDTGATVTDTAMRWPALSQLFLSAAIVGLLALLLLAWLQRRWSIPGMLSS